MSEHDTGSLQRDISSIFASKLAQLYTLKFEVIANGMSPTERESFMITVEALITAVSTIAFNNGFKEGYEAGLQKQEIESPPSATNKP